MYMQVPKLVNELQVGDVLALIQERGMGSETEVVLSRIVKLEKELTGINVLFENHGTVSSHWFSGTEPHRPLMTVEAF